jgi:Holliday junction resolvase
MSAAQRTKGAAAKRELCRLLADELGFVVRRNVDQARAGGADCLQVQGFAIECKRHEKLSRPAWWAQACRQGEKAGAEPLLFYRCSREPWRALVHTIHGGYREATFSQAVTHIREKLACWP